MWVGGQRHTPATLFPGKSWYPFYRRLGGPQGRSGQMGKFRLNGNRSPDRPARNESLYRLSYPGPHQRYDFLFVLFLSLIFVKVRSISAGSTSQPSATVMMPKESESTGNGSEDFLRFHIFIATTHKKKKQGMSET